MKNQIIIPICLVLILASCTTAKKASEVNAVYVPSAQYASMSCEDLYNAAEEIRAKTPALERAVDETRKQDKVKEQVAWWLFAPAAFFLQGNADEQTALSLAKGQLEAIRNAGLKGKCN